MENTDKDDLKKDIKIVDKRASSVGIEPTTSRLTVERANRLRHEDWQSSLE